jgi:hypothetical protein
MAKQTKKANPKPRASGVMIKADPPELASPSQEDFKGARELLRQRAAALILDLAKRYVASKAAELTTVLDAMDSLAEFERMHRAAVKPTAAASCAGPGDQAIPSAEGGNREMVQSAKGLRLYCTRRYSYCIIKHGACIWRLELRSTDISAVC